MKACGSFRSQSAFTLIELIVVLILMGILSAVTLPRFFDINVFQRRGFFDEAIGATRYAHKRAIASGCDVRVSFSAAGYSLDQRAACAGAFGTQLNNPGTGLSFSNNSPPAGTTITSDTFYFDRAGQPRNPDTSLRSAVSSISIGSESFSIEPFTGYVHP